MSTREDRRADAIDYARTTYYGTPPPVWVEACNHGLGARGIETCADEDECRRRHLNCTCAEAHETETECGPWLRENPPDVDVNGETDDH